MATVTIQTITISPSTTTHAIGEVVQIATLFSLDGAAVDPTTVKFTYKPLALGTATTLTYGVDAGLVKDSTGNYHVNLDTTAYGGNWNWRFYSTGTNQASIESTFYVRPNAAITTTVTPASLPLSAVVQTLNGTAYADQYVGADAGAKIAAALATLPAAGGVVDARGFQGAQTFSTPFTIGPYQTLLLGAATFTCTYAGICITMQGGARLIGISRDASIVTQNATAAPYSLVQVVGNSVWIEQVNLAGPVTAGTEANEALACIFVTYSGAVAPISNLTVKECYLSGKVAGIFTNDTDNTNVFGLQNCRIIGNKIRTLHFGIILAGYLQTLAVHSQNEIAFNDIQVTAAGAYSGFINARPMQVWMGQFTNIHDNWCSGGFASIEVISSPASSLLHMAGNRVAGNHCDSHLSFTQSDGGVCSDNVVDMAFRPAGFPAYDNATVVAAYGYQPGIEFDDMKDSVCVGNIVRGPVGCGIDFGAAASSSVIGNQIYNANNTATPDTTIAAGILLNYGLFTDCIVANNTVDTCKVHGIAQVGTADLTAAITRITIIGNKITNCQRHGIHTRSISESIISNNHIYAPNLAASTYNGIDFTDDGGGATYAVSGVIVEGNIIHGGKYGIYQPFVDATSNRLSCFRNNMASASGTQAFFINGRCSGNWDGNNGFVPLAILTSTHLDMSLGMREVQLDPGGPATLAYLDNGTIGDVVRIRFLRADTLVTNQAGRLELAGSANVTPTLNSIMVFECFADANNVGEAWGEISRAIR